MKLSLGYNDVNLLAQPSKIKSRRDIPVEGWRIFVAPMPPIVGEDFIKAVADLPIDWRPSLCIPKTGERDKLVELAWENELTNVWVGIGLDDNDREFRSKYNTFLLDTANGYLEIVKRRVQELYECGYSVMAGNVHTFEGVRLLRNSGASIIRCGIGGGSVCSTSIMTGYGRGQITELSEVCNGVYDVVADGGISHPGDIVKAFGAGASGVMIGKIFAACDEAENVVNEDYKYWGLATEFEKKTGFFIEGHSIQIPSVETRPLKDILYILWDGIRSGISYSGYNNVTEFIGNGVFERSLK